MKGWRAIVAMGIFCLSGFFLWALWPEKSRIEPVGIPPPGSEVAVVASSASIPLISGGQPIDVSWTSRSPAARRVRRIFPDPAWMTPEPSLKKGDVITLALFEDAVFDAKIRDVTRHSNGAVGVTAHLTGDEQGAIYLAYRDQTLRASVEVMGGADYLIRYQSDESGHYAVEVDRERSIILDGADSLVSSVREVLQDASVPVAATELVASENALDESTLVDVMIVYTPAAATWAAGDPDEDGIDSLIALVMQRANEAHANSDTQITLRLVHSAPVSYVESTAYQGYKQDLTRLSGASDGYMDDVHDWRNTYGADFVCLLETNDEVGGYGQLLSNPSGDSSRAFCLARVEQASWTYTVVHEWGHNMGCHHSKTQASSPGTGLHSYSSGWQWNDSAAASTYSGSSYYGADGYCSVMTYENFDGLGSGAGSKEYRRVAHFSNPDVTYTGDSTNPTGDADDGDNARTIRDLRSVIAAYRAESLDWDADGLPNEWEQLYFGGETNANPSAMASNGVNTLLQAYVAGLNPTDPSALFEVALTNGFVVRWNTTSGRVYSVWSTMELSEGFQTLETTVPWPRSSWTDTVERAGNFYRVGVELDE